MKLIKNKNVVIYFYPKDSTPGCTTEGQEFRDSYKKFKKLNTEILGVSENQLNLMKTLSPNKTFHLSFYLIQMKRYAKLLMYEIEINVWKRIHGCRSKHISDQC